MSQERTAQARFQKLDNERASLLRRCEAYSRLTLPYLFPDDDYDQDDGPLQNSEHSVGAQAVNHLANKIMLALFQPTTPFFRLSLSDAAQQQLIQQLGIEQGSIEQVTSMGEKRAMTNMARHNFRPELFELVKLLIVTGNGLPIFDPDAGNLTVLDLRDYVVQRNRRGELVELLTKETMKFESLEPDAAQAFTDGGGSAQADTEVTLYHWVGKRPGANDFVDSQWIDNIPLGEDFESKYKPEKLPYKPQVWVLPRKGHYGVGLVEEYYGDLSSIDVFAGSQNDGAMLAAFWRFLVNPGSESSPEEFAQGRNGDAVAGVQSDVTLLSAPVSNNLAAVNATMQEIIQRVGRGFLMLTSVQRDAERVTAQEIRALANELETGLGGVYTRLAVSLQQPIADYLLNRADLQIDGTAIEVTIITGFEALSRQSELERMNLFLGDVANISNLPPEIRDWLREEEIYNYLASGRGLERAKFLRSAEEVQQRQDQRAQQQQQRAMQLEQAKRQPQQGDAQ